MDQSVWDAVDEYAGSMLVHEDEALRDALRASEAAGMPSIAVSAAHGKMLHLLARAQRARRILEIGTLGGYSTIWLARALQEDGRLITLEVDARHAQVAAANVRLAGVADRVDIRVGPAIEALPALQNDEPFDLVYIDADKPSTPDYFRWAMKLSRSGTLIIVDNVVRRGALVEADSGDAGVEAMRQLMELVASEPRVSATLIQTVGVKGYDGFLLAHVEDEPVTAF
jgi:predicted O-methyltransferase YrrM